MILLGCLLAFSAAVAPRVVLVIAWIFSDRWPLVWGSDFVVPLLGIIFLPYTTIMYMLAYQVPVGVEGTEWLWVLLGLFLDLWKYSQMAANRKEAMATTQKYYPAGAPGYGAMGGTTDAAVSTGQMPPSDSTTAPDIPSTSADSGNDQAGGDDDATRPPTSV